MARSRTRARTKELPPPLPPGERTVGQVVGETIRAYGERFWLVLPLGIPIAVSSQLSLGRSANAQTLILLALSPLIALAYLRACALILKARPSLRAYGVALLVFLPVPFLVRIFVLPALAWLALFGLAVPATMLEGLNLRSALERARRLAAADYPHALGSLCALAIVVAVSELTLIVLLRSQGDNGERVAHALADLVLTPMLYLGGALLYTDQAARVGSPRSAGRNRRAGRRRDADLHPPVDADAAGRPDAQVES
jgi:hypothetical protein